MPTALVFSVIIIFVIGFLIHIFNQFARNRNMVKDAWSNIDVALKRRHDLVPNLVSIVKGYASHEKDTLNQVVEARNKAMNIPKNDINAQIDAEKGLQHALGKLFVLVESYPDLKANSNFLDLQQKLSEIEENLERSRRYYNSTVRVNNTYGESIPGALFTNVFKYQHFDYFEVEASDRINVDIKL